MKLKRYIPDEALLRKKQEVEKASASLAMENQTLKKLGVGVPRVVETDSVGGTAEGGAFGVVCSSPCGGDDPRPAGTGCADGQMFQFAFTASQPSSNLPKQMGSAQLTEEHGRKLAPTSEPSGMTFGFCLFHSLLELNSRKQL